MKKSTFMTAVLSAIALSGSAFAATTATPTKDSTTFNTQMDKVSYTIGYKIGKSTKEQNIDLNDNLFIQGFQAATKGTTPAISETDMQTVMQDFQKQMMQKALEKQKELADTNAKASDAYMAKVMKESGVEKLTDGVYYKVDTKGTGKVMPTANDQVVVTYKGMLPNGKVFDQTQAGKTATFPVSGVIPGFKSALEKMTVGSSWTVYIAPDQAYGKYAPPMIGPNQALTFKVTLKDIKPASVDAKADAMKKVAQ
ncbi:FKBP-type peptidyl-prolyl cis-trans isomerase [Thiotrichales bacterium 19S3-7]|nr:FKBP-type peptidyl-prolyl cis-trans isomerase [Thiotrichales bacterium 19S3-7]MCF6801670.1 FKBP-type peptidyl-prolyl cis-trans isomerase [Thiotrichales bacterium 19S3-11]